MKTHQKSLPTKCEFDQPQDPRVRRTRQLLEDAFRFLAKQRSYSSISVQDITEQATVNRATFYSHYIDKDDLAASVLRNDMRKVMVKQFHEIPPFDAPNLEAMATTFFGFMESIHSACPKMRQELPAHVSNMLQEELYSLLEHWLSTSNTYLRFFPNCSKSAIVSVMSWSIYGSAVHWVLSQKREPAAQVCHEIVSVLLKEPCLPRP